MEDINTKLQKAVSYAHQIITEASSFKDFSNALIDYIGKDIHPYCKTIYSVIVADLPNNISDKLTIEIFDELEKYTDDDLLVWYKDYKQELEYQKQKQNEKEIIENIDELITRVRKFRDKNEFSKLLDFVGKCNYLAPYNAMLVELQKPGCSFVFSAKKWNEKYFRQPKPNAQNLITLIPFGPVQCMYDFSDTEPIPNSGHAVTETELMEEWDKSLLNAEGKVAPSEMFYLKENLPAYGVYLDDKFNAANTYGGYLMQYDQGNLKIHINKEHCLSCKSRFIISVNKNQPTECSFHTICHELGHLFCRHLYYDKSKIRHLSLKEREFEAETVAWLVCKRHGVKNPSEEYLAGYAPNGEIPEISIDFVMKAVTEIEKMLSDYVFAKKALWYKEDKYYKTIVDNTCEGSKNRKK